MSESSIKPIIEMKNIHKRFPGVYALKNVSLDIKPGEVHALMGENGAGKSTLIKIMSGAYTFEEGIDCEKNGVTNANTAHITINDINSGSCSFCI